MKNTNTFFFNSAPPRFPSKKKTKRIKAGETAVLKCRPEGDQPIKMIWKMNGILMRDLEEER